MKSDYIGTGQKMIKLIDYALCVESITASDAAVLLQCSRKTCVRLFKRLDLISYELTQFAIDVSLSENQYGVTTLKVNRR